MLWFKFKNTAATGNDVYVNLCDFTVVKSPLNDWVELWPNKYYVSQERYLVEGPDHKRLVKIMEREAERAVPADMGVPQP